MVVQISVPKILTKFCAKFLVPITSGGGFGKAGKWGKWGKWEKLSSVLRINFDNPGFGTRSFQPNVSRYNSLEKTRFFAFLRAYRAKNEAKFEGRVKKKSEFWHFPGGVRKIRILAFF